MLEMFSTRPYIWGTYCWNMFEFAAAGRNEAGDPGKNHKGLVTFDRKEKRMRFIFTRLGGQMNRLCIFAQSVIMTELSQLQK